MKRIFMAMAVVAIAMGCGLAKQNGGKGKSPSEIPYTIAQRYFVKNGYNEEDLANPKITSSEKFNRLFGMATVMGKNGAPTSIDFNRQFVVAVVGVLSDALIHYQVHSLTKEGETLVLRYTQRKDPPAGFGSQSLLLVVVDNKYDAEVWVEEVER
jgi:hypothetical protein